MPREKLDLPLRVDHLSILDEDGQLDEELEPDLDDDLLRRIYHDLVLSRRFDARLLQLQREGNIGTFAPVKGQEAAQIGAVAALKDSDRMVPAFREIAASVWRGLPLDQLIVYNAGYNEGADPGEDPRDLPITVPVASQIPVAAGLAYGAKLLDTGDVVLTFFGDGATSEGDFHEALNFAGVFGCPVVFVCQNNQWAISLPRERQTEAGTLAQKAMAAGIPGIQVDGNDVLAMYVATREAVERARGGDGPTLIEAVTYRLSMHTTVDDPSLYRTDDEVKKWEARDPIPRFRDYLKAKGVLDDDAVSDIDDDVKQVIDDAWQKAKQRIEELGSPDAMFEHVYAEVPPYLDRQRAAVAGESPPIGGGGPGSVSGGGGPGGGS